MTTLENLYYGNIDPANKYIKCGIEYSKLLNLLMRNEEKLVPTLSKKHKVIFEKHKDCISIAEKYSFIQGLKLGIKIATESFLTDSPNFNET